jgi:signal transduction histidine kinase
VTGDDGGATTTYAATSPRVALVDLAAGLGLIAAGAIAWLERPLARIGGLAMLAGVVWLAPRWVGWGDGPAARSVAMVVAPFLPALLFHLVLAAPTGTLQGRAARLGVAFAYAATAVYSTTRALVRDPFLDLHCWSNCSDNVFLVRAEPAFARSLESGWRYAAVALAAATVAAAAWRLATGTRRRRAELLPLAVPAALAAAGEGTYAVALLRNPAESPGDTVFLAVFTARALALVLLAVGVAWIVGRAVRQRHAVSRLAADLGEAPAPGALQAALARSLGDPDVAVAYWLSGSRRYVDAAGRPFDVDSRPGSVATPIVRSGEPVALVLHDRISAGTRELEQEIGAAARLAVDNERLRAEILAQLEDLRASRARIVETADTTRRRLERDLHDGAQQRLLALSFELRLAQAAAAKEADDGLAGLLAEASDEARNALRELRELAHGIYPAVLTEAGLAPALATLADGAAVVVDLDVDEESEERYPEPVERAAYVAVAEAISDAVARGATWLAVRVRRDGERLVVDVDVDPGAGATRSSDRLVHVADRVGALGGRLETGAGTLRAVLPCE